MRSNSAYDLVIRNGRVVTQGQVRAVDVGVCDGVITAIAAGLDAGARDIDAAGHWVLPGGVDSHCHVEQRSGKGMMGADDFYSATVAAAFGGTTKWGWATYRSATCRQLCKTSALPAHACWKSSRLNRSLPFCAAIRRLVGPALPRALRGMTPRVWRRVLHEPRTGHRRCRSAGPLRRR